MTLEEFKARAAALLSQNRIEEAAGVYREAVRAFPDIGLVHANLAALLIGLGDYEGAKGAYRRALEIDPRNPVSYLGLSDACARSGDERAALEHFQAAMALRPLQIDEYAGSGEPVRVLVLASAIATNANTNIVGFFDRALFRTILLYIDRWTGPLPEHDVVFNAISDADAAAPAMAACELLLRQTAAPVINHPEKLMHTGRVDVARRLADIDGVRMPRVVRVRRGERPDLPFPLLLRSPGFHSGRHFVLVRGESEFAAQAKTLPGDELLAIEFADTRASDGLFYKYRVMAIGGALYPVHLAISDAWNVHYATAGMEQSPQRREAERAFLEGFPVSLQRAVPVIAAVARELALDYAGIDFGLDSEGRVVVFEANATMGIFDGPRGPEFEYRRPAILRARDAVTRLAMTARRDA